MGIVPPAPLRVGACGVPSNALARPSTPVSDDLPSSGECGFALGLAPFWRFEPHAGDLGQSSAKVTLYLAMASWVRSRAACL
jgi:hypothetical protein